MYGCEYGQVYCSDSRINRSFLTKEEKIEMLKEYKEALDKESQGVAERIAQMSKQK